MPEPASTTTIDTAHQLTGTIHLAVLSVSRKLQDSRNKFPLPESGGTLGEISGFLLLSEAVNIDSAVFCCYRSEGGVGCSGSPVGERNTFHTEAREHPCSLLEEVQRWRSALLQRCQHEQRDAGAKEGTAGGGGASHFYSLPAGGGSGGVLASFCTHVSSI